MSHRATTWAWQQDLPAFQKLVLLALADRHNNDTGRCDPSLDRVANDCGMAKTSVKTAVRELQQRGLITAIQRKNGPANLSNFYTFTFKSSGVGQEPPQGGAGAAPGVGQEPPPNLELEPVIEPSSPPRGVDVRHNLVREHFKKLWLLNNKGAPAAPWSGRDAGVLAKLLKDNPKWSSTFIIRCLDNWAVSEMNHAENAFRVLPVISRYASAPLDKFSKPTKTAHDEFAGFTSA